MGKIHGFSGVLCCGAGDVGTGSAFIVEAGLYPIWSLLIRREFAFDYGLLQVWGLLEG